MSDTVDKPCVLIIVENLPVPLDRRVWQECIALRDAGFEVVVICPQMRGHTLPEEERSGIKIHRHWIAEEAVTAGGFLREYASALWGEFRLAWKIWRRHQFKIVHLCNPPDLLFLVAWPFKLLGAKVVYDVHDLCPEMFEAKFGKRGVMYWAVRLAERLTYACADVVLATNETAREVGVERGRKAPGEIFVVRTAPNIHASDCMPDYRLKKGRKFLVGYVGVMGSADGVDCLIDAADHIVNHKGREDIQFLLMGAGPEYEALIRQRERLGLTDFVDLPGWADSDFLFTALRTMDLGVSCDPINSYSNGCTMNKVLEYMAFGKAQVMFDLKEGRASAEDAALYVPDCSPAKFADAVMALLDDPNARERMGRRGEERMRTQLNWERSVVQLLKAYRSATNKEPDPVTEEDKRDVFPRGPSVRRVAHRQGTTGWIH